MTIDFVRAPSKKSLLAMLKKAKEITPGLLRKFFDGVVFKSEINDAVTASDWYQNGFPDAAEVSLAWDDSTRTLTVDSVGDDFSFFHDGNKYTRTGPDTETITDTEGLWVFYYESGTSLASVANPTDTQVASVIENETIVAYVYWDAANNDGRLLGELHGSSMSPETHKFLHYAMGAQYVHGLGVTDISTEQDGSLAAHAQFGIATGSIYDEDITHVLPAVASTTGMEVYWTDTNGYTRWDTNAGYPVLTTGTGRLAYSNAGTPTEVTDGNFVLCHVFATNIEDDAGAEYPAIAVMGQAQYATLNLARDGAESEITTLVTGDWPVEETVPLYTMIYQTKDTYANAVNARIRTTDTGDDYIDWRSSAISSSGGSATDHGALSGLGDDDHTQYLLASAATDRATFATNWTDLTDAGDTTLHGHDVTGLTNWPTVDYSYVSGNDAATDVTAAQLEELSDGSATTLHDHDVTGLTNWPTINYAYVSGNDAGTNVTAAELEELSDGSATVLHTHGAAGAETLTITVKNNTGSPMAARDLCYISGDASGTPNVILADADAEATSSKMLVVLSEAIVDNATGSAITIGKLTGFSGLTASAIQYVHTTAGDFTETAPFGTGDIVRVAGYALSTTAIFFNPGGSWVEIV